MEVFDTVKKTLLAIISDGGDDKIHVEKLVAIGGLIRPDLAFQLMERGKVRELIVPKSEIRQKTRIFEDFEQKSIFDWKSEWELRREKRKRRGMEKYRETQTRRSFVEVEHAKKKDTLQFFYPKIHYCPCRFFQKSVLENQTDWICVHILAYYFSRNFQKIEKIDCKIEIIEILSKILLRSVV
ncbi:hypothetical protein B9Z55_021692 [Caenorhabditis nigoni]|uniref:SWIM-type domain-containing protein n=1 Tax=Caenorhabditis nigoni TaxID=1611254 RepID=A0A2G5TT25_9PELO|nr:hypothetical protein B9Z55_021692 [Caenorhabditis nigoni]